MSMLLSIDFIIVSQGNNKYILIISYQIYANRNALKSIKIF